MAPVMEKSELSDLKDQIDSLVNAFTKKEARPLYNRLNSQASNLRGEINPRYHGKLMEAIDFAWMGSGQVQDKDHWISQMEAAWYTFEGGVGNSIV